MRGEGGWSGGSSEHRVGVLVFDGMKMLDLSGPAEVFSEANRFGAAYRLSIVSVGGKPARSSIGVPVSADADALDTRLRHLPGGRR